MTCMCGSTATTTAYINLVGADPERLDRLGLAGRRMLACFVCRTCATDMHRNPEAGLEHVLGRLAEKLERS